MFNFNTADRVIELERRRRLVEGNKSDTFDGNVHDGLLTYFHALFADDAVPLGSRHFQYWNRPFIESVQRYRDVALELATAYCNYVAEQAWQRQGMSPNHDDLHTKEDEDDDEAWVARCEEIWLVQKALTIADKLGIDTDEVIWYYGSRAWWMPPRGTTWDTVWEQYRAWRAQVRAQEQAA